MAGNIGIIGRARVGKDTAGKWLVDNRGYERVGFADALKDAALKLDPIVYSVPYTDDGIDWDVATYRLGAIVRGEGWEDAKRHTEVRRTLQELGASIRAIDPEFWLRTALKKVTAANEGGSPAVITDVRYPNEAESLRRAGFHLLYIDRPDVPQLVHESEGALTPEDAGYVIHNDGELEDFLTDVEVFAHGVETFESRWQYSQSH